MRSRGSIAKSKAPLYDESVHMLEGLTYEEKTALIIQDHSRIVYILEIDVFQIVTPYGIDVKHSEPIDLPYFPIFYN
jgi:hypothetical protein